MIVFGDVIANMISNEKRNSVITELFIRGKKLNISIVFMNKSFFEVPKEVRFYTLVFWKFQTKERFNKLQLVIRQILTSKILWIYMENA